MQCITGWWFPFGEQINLSWSIVCYTWPHPPLPRAWKTSWKIVSLVRQPGISKLTACAPPLLHVQLMKQPKKGVPKNSTFLNFQVSNLNFQKGTFSGTSIMCFRHQQWSQWNPMESATLKTSACATWQPGSYTCQSRTSTRCRHCRCPQRMWTWCGRQCLPKKYSSFARANTKTRKKTEAKANTKTRTRTKTNTKANTKTHRK